MGFRFRKSFKVMPGVRLNLSKSGFSTSLGGPGATVNLSKRGVRSTLGIPGSGLSYSSKIGGRGSGSGQELAEEQNAKIAFVDDAAAHGLLTYAFTTAKGSDVTLEQIGGVVKIHIDAPGAGENLVVKSVQSDPEKGRYLLISSGAQVLCSEEEAAHVADLLKVAVARQNYLISRGVDRTFAVIFSILKVVGVIIIGTLSILATIAMVVLAASAGTGRRR